MSNNVLYAEMSGKISAFVVRVAGEIVFGLVFCLSEIVCRSDPELSVSLVNFDILSNLQLVLSFARGY